jgi:hypothetical protein
MNNSVVVMLELRAMVNFDFYKMKFVKDASKNWRSFFKKALKEKVPKIKYTIISPNNQRLL